jgi:hypothetical protein
MLNEISLCKANAKRLTALGIDARNRNRRN